MDENYGPWRRRWLRWHSRSLLASIITLAGAERQPYLDRMRSAYHDLGDFTQGEVDFIFQRVWRGLRRLGSRASIIEISPLTQQRIREQGQRLMAEANRLGPEEL